MPRVSHRPTLRTAGLALAILLASGLRARGASIWELTPYQVCVWVAAEQQPELGDEFIADLSRRIRQRSESVVGGAWRVQVLPAPQQLTRAVRGTDTIPIEIVEQVDPLWYQFDKIVLVSVRHMGSVYAVDARELDVSTHQWGNRVSRRALQCSVVPDAAFRAVADCFAPLGRVERVDDDQAKIALKAGALALGEYPVLIDEGALLQPISRRNDGHGRVQRDKDGRVVGIRLVPWTVLKVSQRQEGESTVQCDIHSGIRRAMRGRSSYRTKRLALTIRSELRPTTLELKSRVNQDQPLAGYQIVVRTNLGDDAEPTRLGETNAAGQIVLPPGDGRLQLVYARSGNRVLARLPIVPGRAPTVTVFLSDDEPRLAAEAFLSGIEDRLVDVAVNRAFTAARIRGKIEKGEIEDATKLLNEFRLMETDIALKDALQREKAQITGIDSVTEAEIDRLFRKTRERIGKYIDPQLERRLSAELADAKANPKPKPAEEDDG